MDYVATVRYGDMHFTARFRANFTGLNMGDKCVCRTDRGVEVGEIVSRVLPLDRDQERPSGEILRKLTAADTEKLAQITNELQPQQYQFCQQKIRERGLPMKLTHVEHLFGDTKTIFYFLAQGRVDFRALVKDLAQQYHQRIEMRQIGVRDEARLLAYYEHCGRELCCRTFIKRLEPVSMKMAKNQKATLDPNKISGRCGRLMCCLRFEDETYEELRRALPRKGTQVRTEEGEGRVTATEVLSQLVSVRLEDGRETVAPLEAIEILKKGRGGRPPKDRGDSDDKGEADNKPDEKADSKPDDKPDDKPDGGDDSGAKQDDNAGKDSSQGRGNRGSRGGRGRGGRGGRGRRGRRSDSGGSDGGNKGGGDSANDKRDNSGNNEDRKNG